MAINWFYAPQEGYIPDRETQLDNLNVTQNGTYNPDPGKGFAQVNVNVEGGGSSWQTVYDGSVTTEENEFGMIVGLIEDAPELTADELKITFNGVEYICPKNAEFGSYGAPFNEGTFDWSEYPFNINGSNLVTQTAGTYTLKIEEEQGGSSDFTTATVIFRNLQPNSVYFASCFSIVDDVLAINSREVGYSVDRYFTVPLYKGKVLIPLSSVRDNDTSYMPTIEGNATLDIESFAFVVTGDCTISAKGIVQG